MHISSNRKIKQCHSCGADVIVRNNIASNMVFCDDCRKKVLLLTCVKCSKTFNGKVKSGARSIICQKCLSEYSSDLEFSDLSSRTITKIIKRANLSCAECGWNECTCDIHHIISSSKGGMNDLNNLVYLCPNCHRKAHNKLISVDRLFSISLSTFRWRDFYQLDRHPNIDIDALLDDAKLMTSGEIALKYSISSKIIYRILKEHGINSKKYERNRKFEVSKEELEVLIKEKPMTEIGKQFGVSGGAVKKRCKKLGIELKPMRGYWSKLRAGK